MTEGDGAADSERHLSSSEREALKKQNQFMDSMADLELTDDEKLIAASIGKKIYQKTLEEARRESEDNPEIILISGLNKIAEKLESEGLAEDAKILRYKITLINRLIDSASQAINAKQYEIAYFSQLSSKGQTDIPRLMMLMKETGIKNPDGISPSSISLVGEDKQEQNISDEGLQIVLEELGLVEADETATQLKDEKYDHSRGGYIVYRNKMVFGSQMAFYSYLKHQDGNDKKSLLISLNPSTVISAALRKIQADKTD